MRLSYLASAVALAAMFASSVRAADNAKLEVVTIKNVAYYEGKDADPIRHKLDVYLPKGKTDFPVVFFVHGGAWMFGSKDILGLYSAVGRFLASQGIGAVLPNYRLSPSVKHPEHVRDVTRAFAWTHSHIARYGGDPQRLFVGGHSAGGHLSALLVTDESYLQAEGLSRKAIRGVIAVSGVYTIPDKVAFEMPAYSATPGAKVNLSFNPFDLAFGKDPAGRKAASPLTYVSEGLPPFLVISAERDLPMLPEMAEELVAAIKRKGGSADLLQVKDRQHSTVLFRAVTPTDPAAKAILSFVAKHGT